MNPSDGVAADQLLAEVRARLATVQDPDLHRDLVTLGMIRNLRRAAGQDGDIAFDLVLTTAACPVKQQLEDQCRAAAGAVPGIGRVLITVSAEVPQGRKGDLMPGVRHIIAVGSGKGGVGKSTVAVNLAAALAASGARTGLIDADIYGPSVPHMLGITGSPKVQDKKMQPPEAHGLKVMSMGFLVADGQPVVWRGPMIQGAFKQFLTDVAWGELDYLIIDLPPGTGDIQMTLTGAVPLAGAVIVSTPQTVALLDARRACAMFLKAKVGILGVVENMSDFVCPACGHVEPIFAHGGAEREAHALAVPFLGRIPLEPAIRASGDDGIPVVVRHPASRSAEAFRAIAAQVARQVSMAALQPDGAAAG